MYADRVACCPLVSHGEYDDGTDGQTPDHITLRFSLVAAIVMTLHILGWNMYLWSVRVKRHWSVTDR